MKNNIYYIGEFTFPNGQAASYRVLGNVLALQAAGYDVTVVGRSESPNPKPSVCGMNSGVRYVQLNDYWPRSASKMFKLLRYVFRGVRFVNWLHANSGRDATAIILAGGYSRFLLLLIPLTRWWNVPLIVDVVEWYEPEHCTGGKFGPMRWDVEMTLRYLVPAAGYAISISSFLMKHFVSQSVRTVRVPPLIDAHDEKWSNVFASPSNYKLRLLFVGNAGQKDFIVNAIRGLALLGDSAKGCEIEMVGPSREEVRSNLGPDAGLLDTLDDSLSFAGRLPHREALQRLAHADYSILLRPDARFAHAGFPTKLVESLTMGVPVICNLTSDIGLYVRDGHEGIVVKDCSPEAFAQGVRRALAMSLDERGAMRRDARNCAELSFDYLNWVKPLGEFMDTVIAHFGHHKNLVNKR